jgi:hypothetical protein
MIDSVPFTFMLLSIAGDGTGIRRKAQGKKAIGARFRVTL